MADVQSDVWQRDDMLWSFLAVQLWCQSVCRLVRHFVSGWNISTNFGWTVMKFTDIQRINPNELTFLAFREMSQQLLDGLPRKKDLRSQTMIHDFGALLTFPLAPPWRVLTEMSLQLWVTMKFGTDVYVAHGMNCKITDLLTFNLALSSS